MKDGRMEGRMEGGWRCKDDVKQGGCKEGYMDGGWKQGGQKSACISQGGIASFEAKG
jgi:hypothetical protein